jgi:hypothetical protein
VEEDRIEVEKVKLALEAKKLELESRKAQNLQETVRCTLSTSNPRTVRTAANCTTFLFYFIFQMLTMMQTNAFGARGKSTWRNPKIRVQNV